MFVVHLNCGVFLVAVVFITASDVVVSFKLLLVNVGCRGLLWVVLLVVVLWVLCLCECCCRCSWDCLVNFVLVIIPIVFVCILVSLWNVLLVGVAENFHVFEYQG